MRTIPATELLDEVSAAMKKKLMQRSIVNPAELVTATGDDSWTIDGREDLDVSSRLVISLIRAHSSNNQTDEAADASFSNSEGKTVIGNPIIFGTLSTKNVTIMGNDEAPLLVMSASGRQTSKAAEWLTAFLGRCRKILQRVNGDTTKAQGLIMAEDADKATSAVIASLAETDWLLIFKGGSKIGKPLASTNYSAVCWLKVGYGQGKPTTRRALEDSKRDNLRVPSSFTGEAMSTQKLVHSYILDDGFSEEGALRHVRSLVANPIAVGANADPSEEYVQQIYRFASLCDEARAIVDTETDPIKALTLLGKTVKKCFVAMKATHTRADGSEAVWTVNRLTEADQLAILNPPKKEPKPKAEPKKKAVAEAADSRFISIKRYPEAARRLSVIAKGMSEESKGVGALSDEKRAQQREIEAIAAFVRYQTQGAKALKARPWLAEAVARIECDEDPYLELQDLVESWDGDSGLFLREPECDEDGNPDEADASLLKKAEVLLNQLIAAINREGKMKPKDKIAWATNWLIQKSAEEAA